MPRFDQSFTGSCEQQNLETSALQKRFLEGKAKRQVKKTERKPDLPAISGNLHSSVVHVVCGTFMFWKLYDFVTSQYDNDDRTKINSKTAIDCRILIKVSAYPFSTIFSSMVDNGFHTFIISTSHNINNLHV